MQRNNTTRIDRTEESSLLVGARCQTQLEPFNFQHAFNHVITLTIYARIRVAAHQWSCIIGAFTAIWPASENPLKQF